MNKTITHNNITINYTHTVKNVKNINLRISSDCIVSVSANRWVSQNDIERFLIQKWDFIIKALNKFKNMPQCEHKQYFTEAELKQKIIELCSAHYLYFKQLGVEYPQIRFRKMTSRWGSCHPAKKLLTFNTNLMYAPFECIEYVVLHEFTHFLQANHSAKFYGELSKVCPDWKKLRAQLKGIYIK